jgi:hypothetical protein
VDKLTFDSSLHLLVRKQFLLIPTRVRTTEMAKYGAGCYDKREIKSRLNRDYNCVSYIYFLKEDRI